MQLAKTINSELSDLVRVNITEYKADADTMGKNFRRTLLGIAAYYVVKHLGPESGLILGTMTYVTAKAALVYSVVRGYQTVRDFFRYI